MVLFFVTALAGLPSALAFGIADTATFVMAAAAFPLILAGTFGGEMLFRHFGTRAYRQVALLTLIGTALRSEEHTSEIQSLMRISYAVFCLKIKKEDNINKSTNLHAQILSEHTYELN